MTGFHWVGLTKHKGEDGWSWWPWNWWDDDDEWKWIDGTDTDIDDDKIHGDGDAECVGIYPLMLKSQECLNSKDFICQRGN